LNPLIVREYDIRGTVGVNLYTEDAKSLGFLFACFMRQEGMKNVCVCRDGRLTSPELTNALIESLAASGINVIDIGVGPTPMLYFSVKASRADAGIMVTGSHNPKQDNGFKICLNSGPFFGQQLRQLLEFSGTDLPPQEPGKVTRTLEYNKSYLEMLAQTYAAPMDNRPLAKTTYNEEGRRPLRVCFDPGNGAMGDVLQDFIKKIQKGPGPEYKLDATIINQEIDGNFPNHHPDPSVIKNLQQLMDHVKQNKMDVGIAFDGDGDRIGVVDEKGRALWGDQITTILAYDTLKQYPGATIIGDVKCSQVLFDEITNKCGTPLMSATGHSIVKLTMMKTKAKLAGEMSGHIFFADNNYFDDGMYAAIRLLNILHYSDLTIGQMLDMLPKQHNTPEQRIPCDDDKKFQVIASIANALKNDQTATVDETDGVRVKTKDGWWVARASNTQPALTVRLEGNSEEGLNNLKKHLQQYLKIEF